MSAPGAPGISARRPTVYRVVGEGIPSPSSALSLLLLLQLIVLAQPRAAPLRAPQMGWLTWAQYGCAAPPRFNCTSADDVCINERLLVSAASRLAADGYLAAGYTLVLQDDCAVAHARDPVTHALPLDPERFPKGLVGVAESVHAMGALLGVYTAVAYETCTVRWHNPGSRGFEAVDVATWAAAGVDYLKADGCGDSAYFATGYAALGAAIGEQPRPMAFSCSWPYYIGGNETTKDWAQVLDAGCVTGRSFVDVACSWVSVSAILDHYGDNGAFFQNLARRSGFVVDADALLVGTRGSYAPPNMGNSSELCLTGDEERSQFAVYAIMALPLLISINFTTIPAASKAVLLNRDAIAISQDGVVGGLRLTPKGATEVWARNLSSGAVAVALLNRGPPDDEPQNISVAFRDVGLPGGRAGVFDVWRGADLGAFTGGFSALVPPHGAALLRFSAAANWGA